MKNSTLFRSKTRLNNALSCCCCVLFLLFLGLFSQQLSAQGTLVPSCNLLGPLEGCAVADPADTSGDILINVIVARSGEAVTLNYSFGSNSSGAFIRSSTPVVWSGFPGLNISTQTLTVFPGTNVSEFNLILNVVNNQSSPATICSCSKSVSISKVGATSSHTPILCFGQLSTLTAVGSLSDAGSYTYTLLPSGPSNLTGIFPGLPGSEAGITYIVNVESAEFCSTTTSQTITQPAANPIILNCPPTTTTGPCLTQEAINTLFNNWLDSFSSSGGTNRVVVRTPLNPTPPARCGGSRDVTWTGTDDCGQSDTCTRTFTVPNPPTVVLTCPQNGSTPACQTQAAVNTAFALWLETASGIGGCNGILTNNNDGAPSACGGTKTVTFTYTSTCEPLTSTCSATFTVLSPSTVVLTCAQNASTPACQTQGAVNTAFALWLETASGSGGCGGVLTNDNNGAPSACGGTKTVTFTYTSTCEPLTSTCSATFTVLSPSTVVLTCAQNASTPACQTQGAVNTAFALWLETASGSGGCGGVLTNDNNGAPSACGGTKTVTFTYTNTCEPLTSTCSATFTVLAPPTVVLTCPTSTAVAGGQTQAAIDAAYAAWLATASGTGGCGGALTNNSTGAPLACNDSKTVTFTYTSNCAPLTTTCQATFTVGNCITLGHIFPTQTTCCNYVSGNTPQLAQVCTKKLSGRTVGNAIPGVFFYYAYVTAPGSSFTIDVKQTNDGDLNKLFSVQNLQNVRLTTASCGSVRFTASLTNNDKNAHYQVTGATANATYVVSIKYDVKSIIGATYTGPDNVSTYSFGSWVNGVLDGPSAGSIDAVAGCEDTTPLPPSCSLPSAKQSVPMDVKLYPNPSANNFKVNIVTESDSDIQIKVFDMLGKAIESQSVKVSEIDNFEIGARYPSGVYNVIITQGTEVKTQRVIKK